MVWGGGDLYYYNNSVPPVLYKGANLTLRKIKGPRDFWRRSDELEPREVTLHSRSLLRSGRRSRVGRSSLAGCLRRIGTVSVGRGDVVACCPGASISHSNKLRMEAHLVADSYHDRSRAPSQLHTVSDGHLADFDWKLHVRNRPRFLRPA